MKNKHMNQHDRLIIENGLNNCFSFKAITLKLGKDCTTISKELRTNMVHCDISYYGRVFNNCIHRSFCIKEDVCDTCHLSKPKRCHSFDFCRDECQDFVEEICPRLSKPPYACNGCEDKQKSTPSKQMYFALQANKQYMKRLSKYRSSFIINEDVINHLNNLFVPLCKNQGQSVHHVFINHKDELMSLRKPYIRLLTSIY